MTKRIGDVETGQVVRLPDGTIAFVVFHYKRSKTIVWHDAKPVGRAMGAINPDTQADVLGKGKAVVFVSLNEPSEK